MPGRPLPMMRRVAHLALALLLVAPLLAGAHVHRLSDHSSPACSVCTVAKHAPAVIGSVAEALSVAYRPHAVVAAPAAAPSTGSCRRPAGRAPPYLLPVQLA
jgi:hypothetical protein